jgi:hypothetical protein
MYMYIYVHIYPYIYPSIHRILPNAIHTRGRSDNDNGHGPPLRQSSIITPTAAADLLSVDFEADHREFSAQIRTKVTQSVSAESLDRDDYNSGGYAGYGSVLEDTAFTDAIDAAIADSHPLILKQGWLRKLARFGRNMKR